MMEFFKKLKNILNISEKKESNIRDIIEITDKDILYSLNYNIIIRKRVYSGIENNIIFEEYKSFKYLEEMKSFYELDEEYIIFYIDKYEKFKQLINNITTYLELENTNKLMYDYRNYSVFANIFEIISKEQKKLKEFDIIKFFLRFDWVRNCENYRDVSVKLDLCDNNDIEARYKLIKSEKKLYFRKFQR